jgi:hypothetical protein
MKKQLLFSLLLAGVAFCTQAQTRLSLYEEFTGEHCVPCAIANPALQSLIAGNPSKVVLITYPSPIPVGGPIYNTYMTVANARLLYYGVSTAPQGRLDGTKMGTGSNSPVTGHVSNVTQSDINTASSVSTHYSINVSHAWSITGDSITASVTITTPAGDTLPAGANPKLRLALVEDLKYNTAPGINAEHDFPHVVRDMFPSAVGTSIPASWTAGQSATYTVTNRIARYIDKNNARLVAWIQDDADKSVKQVAISNLVAIANDAASTGVFPTLRLQCVPGNASVGSYATLTNAGTATLTSARIYYHSDVNTNLSFVNWSGSLAPGATTIVSLNAVSVPGGNRYIIDSVALPNGVLDINAGNNSGSGSVSIYNTNRTGTGIVTGFENGGAIPSGWLLYDADSNGRNFSVSKNIFGPTAVGYGGSTWFLLHNNYYVPAGEMNYAILPATDIPHDAQMTFAYAHAPFNAENDKLEIVSSTDCGANWTSAWSAAGAAISTAPATTDFFIPTASQWATQTVSLAGIPYNAMVALRATSDYGNALYIDNVRLESASSVKPIASINSVRLYPNPATAEAIIDFNLTQSEALNISILDCTGRSVSEIASGYYKKGRQELRISTDRIAPGFYQLRIAGSGGQVSKPLSVVR